MNLLIWLPYKGNATYQELNFLRKVWDNSVSLPRITEMEAFWRIILPRLYIKFSIRIGKRGKQRIKYLRERRYI